MRHLTPQRAPPMDPAVLGARRTPRYSFAVIIVRPWGLSMYCY